VQNVLVAFIKKAAVRPLLLLLAFAYFEGAAAGLVSSFLVSLAALGASFFTSFFSAFGFRFRFFLVVSCLS